MMEPRLLESYKGGGGYKTNGATETRWHFGNHEIRARVRRGNWQYHMNAGARVSGCYDPGLGKFPEWLEIRCPTMSDEQLDAVTDWAGAEWPGPIVATTKSYMPVVNKNAQHWS